MRMSTMTDLLEEYIKAEQLNDEQMSYVMEGFDLIKKRLELNKMEYNFVLKVLKDKKNRTKTNIEKNSFDETIKDIIIGIEEMENLMTESDTMLKKFLKRIEGRTERNK